MALGDRDDGYAGRWRWRALVLVAAVALGVGLRAGAVRVGYRGDDFVQRAMLRGEFPGARSALDLFRFAGPDLADNRPLLDFGYLPWWASEDLRLSMYRPLASALIALDHQLFGDRTALHHAHSLIWLGLAIVAVGLLFYELLPARVAALAVLLFGVEEAHTLPAAWLANRSPLPALACGGLGLWWLSRAQRTGRWPHRALSLLGLGLALAAGEYALGLLGYFWALSGRPGSADQTAMDAGAAPARPRLQRLGARLLAAVRSRGWWLWVPAGYVALRAGLGYGIRASGYYASPLRAPLAFLEDAAQRMPILAGDALLGIPAMWHFAGPPPLQPVAALLVRVRPELYRALPAAATTLAVLGCLTLAGFAWALRPLWRTAAPGIRHALAVLSVGGLWSLLPAAGALPETRLLGATAIGQAGLSAALIVHLWETGTRGASQAQGRRGLRTRALRMSGLLLLGGLHLGLAPYRDHAQVAQLVTRARADRAQARAADLPEPADAPRTRVYVLAAPDFLTAANLPFARLAAGLPLPRSYQRLSAAPGPKRLHRTGDRQLVLQVLAQHPRHREAGSLYRPASDALVPGARYAFSGLTVEVAAAFRGGATRLHLTFDRALDDPDLWLLQPTPDGLRRIHPPPPGEAIVVESIARQ